MTFDIEEHFQVSAFDSPMRRRHWNLFESRVETNTEKVLGLLDDHKVRGTFFILGWVAEKHPGLIRRIAQAGHEIASHGYGHELVTTLTPKRFREDVRSAKQILEDVVGEPVIGYRAPSFTIVEDTRWALRILVEEGHLYDSSIFPVLHDVYGMPGANPRCHQLATEAGWIWEFPPSTARVGGFRLPVGGGGYFRLFPYPVLQRLLRIAAEDNGLLVMYLHAWELDPAQPVMRGPLLSRFRHYFNLAKTHDRLLNLLREFRFGPIREAIPFLAGNDRCGSVLSPVGVTEERPPERRSEA